MVYSIFHAVLRVVFKVLFRWEIYGRENIPASGGAILAPNHVSLLDPPLIGTSIRRPVYFFARKDLFRPRPWGWLLKKIHSIPIDRENPGPGAFKAILEFLRSGRVVVIFPEGTRGNGRELRKAKSGIGMIAARSGVPVIPAYISGAAAVLPRSARMIRCRKVKIIYGPPLEFAPADGKERGGTDFKRIGAQVMNEIAKLKRLVGE